MELTSILTKQRAGSHGRETPHHAHRQSRPRATPSRNHRTCCIRRTRRIGTYLTTQPYLASPTHTHIPLHPPAHQRQKTYGLRQSQRVIRCTTDLGDRARIRRISRWRPSHPYTGRKSEGPTLDMFRAREPHVLAPLPTRPQHSTPTTSPLSVAGATSPKRREKKRPNLGGCSN